jgi:hypothetical protein
MVDKNYSGEIFWKAFQSERQKAAKRRVNNNPQISEFSVEGDNVFETLLISNSK